MDFIVASHLRWNFVFQRPQQIMTRCARNRRVFFWEEPVFDSRFPRISIEEHSPGVRVITPHLQPAQKEYLQFKVLERLMQELVDDFDIRDHALWYYTPLAIHFTSRLLPRVIIYDCMDELTAFRGAPMGLATAENQLFAKADLVFTGGKSLFDHKKDRHDSVHCFPSSIDKRFFMSARRIDTEPTDQSTIPRPRVGYCGVIDERIDLSLLAGLAQARPDFQIVMIGPIAKISPDDLPKAPNIHYLGQKSYEELPTYFSGWEVGLLPFARNEATRFISPTKTPEYLAAGLPAVSTSITDVVSPYGVKGLALIADDAASFAEAVQQAIQTRHSRTRLRRVDDFLEGLSWDQTWAEMYNLIVQTSATKQARHPAPASAINPVTVAS